MRELEKVRINLDRTSIEMFRQLAVNSANIMRNKHPEDLHGIALTIPYRDKEYKIEFTFLNVDPDENPEPPIQVDES